MLATFASAFLFFALASDGFPKLRMAKGNIAPQKACAPTDLTDSIGVIQGDDIIRICPAWCLWQHCSLRTHGCARLDFSWQTRGLLWFQGLCVALIDTRHLLRWPGRHHLIASRRNRQTPLARITGDGRPHISWRDTIECAGRQWIPPLCTPL